MVRVSAVMVCEVSWVRDRVHIVEKIIVSNSSVGEFGSAMKRHTG